MNASAQASSSPQLLMWDSTIETLVSAMDEWTASGHAVRTVRGSRMRTVRGVLDEFSAALQFPWYFGGNKDAFDECMYDLDGWLSTDQGFVIVMLEFDEILADAPGERSWLFEVLDGTRLAFSSPIPDDLPWSRGTYSLRVIGHRPQRSPGDTSWTPAHWSVENIQ